MTEQITNQIAEAVARIAADAAAKESHHNETTPIEHKGDRMTLPERPTRMSYAEGIELLQFKIDEENQRLDFRQQIDAFPYEAIVAFHNAVEKVYGFVRVGKRTVQGFFGDMEVEPETMRIEVDFGKFEDYLIGQMVLPGTDAKMELRIFPYGILLEAKEVRRKDMAILRRLAEETNNQLRTNSLYKGKAIKVKAGGETEIGQAPQFIDALSGPLPEDVILNEREAAQVETSVYTPITHTAEVRAAGVPLKRGVLLEGPYGTGKTLTAFVTARLAVENGWTFILVEESEDLAAALKFATQYQPAVVFCEDIDRALEVRDDAGNYLLNTVDGILSKGSEVMTVMTTNYVEKLDRAMLRAGRLDAVVRFKTPTAETVQRLCRFYAGERLDAKEDLTAVGELMAGHSSAAVREVVERSKLTSILDGDAAGAITGEGLRLAAEGMADHLELAATPRDQKTDDEILGEALRGVIGAGAKIGVNGMAEQVDDLHDHFL